MMDKIDVRPVIARHVETLSDAGTGRIKWTDIFLFFVLPLLGGIVLVTIRFGFRIDAVNGFLNAFAIFTGLLLNVLVLVFTLAAASSPLNVDLRLRKEVLRQVFVNICFAIINAVAVVCTAMVALAYMRGIPGATTGRIATLLLTAITMNFVFTLVMIIRRMYFLLDKELERAKMVKKAS